MAKEARQLEQDFIATAAEKTGHSLGEWMAIIHASGLQKNMEILKWIKQEHGLNHLQANILASIYLNDGQPVHDYDALFARLFAGKEAQRPLYDAIQALVEQTLPDAELIPTKTYVSIEARRVFGCAKINKQNILVGLDLGDTPFDDYVQKAKSLGAMPNISHMVEVTAPEDASPALAEYLCHAYERTHSG